MFIFLQNNSFRTVEYIRKREQLDLLSLKGLMKGWVTEHLPWRKADWAGGGLTLEAAGESDYISQGTFAYGNKSPSKLWWLKKQRFIFCSCFQFTVHSSPLARKAVLHGKVQQSTSMPACTSSIPAALSLTAGRHTRTFPFPFLWWSESCDYAHSEARGKYGYSCAQKKRKKYQWTMYTLWEWCTYITDFIFAQTQGKIYYTPKR